jgi:hypothetical protein
VNTHAWLDPQYDPDINYWPTLFREEQEAALNRFTGKHPPPLEKNITERRRFWLVPGRSMKDVIENSCHI